MSNERFLQTLEAVLSLQNQLLTMHRHFYFALQQLEARFQDFLQQLNDIGDQEAVRRYDAEMMNLMTAGYRYLSHSGQFHSKLQNFLSQLRETCRCPCCEAHTEECHHECHCT